MPAPAIRGELAHHAPVWPRVLVVLDETAVGAVQVYNEPVATATACGVEQRWTCRRQRKLAAANRGRRRPQSFGLARLEERAAEVIELGSLNPTNDGAVDRGSWSQVVAFEGVDKDRIFRVTHRERILVQHGGHGDVVTRFLGTEKEVGFAAAHGLEGDTLMYVNSEVIPYQIGWLLLSKCDNQ